MKYTKLIIFPAIVSPIITSCSTSPVSRVVNYPADKVRKEFVLKKNTPSNVRKKSPSKNHIIISEGSVLSHSTIEVKLKPRGKITEVTMDFRHKIAPEVPLVIRTFGSLSSLGASRSRNIKRLDVLEAALENPELNFIETISKWEQQGKRP